MPTLSEYTCLLNKAFLQKIKRISPCSPNPIENLRLTDPALVTDTITDHTSGIPNPCCPVGTLDAFSTSERCSGSGRRAD